MTNLTTLARYEQQADILAANGDFRSACGILQEVTANLRLYYGYVYPCPRELRLAAKKELGSWPMF